jgi:hypothetical protein
MQRERFCGEFAGNSHLFAVDRKLGSAFNMTEQKGDAGGEESA